VLDVDYPHCNGTQSIFYADGSVPFASLYGDPLVEYPYTAGFADERGEGEERGFSCNYPLPLGTDWAGPPADDDLPSPRHPDGWC
jgi:acetoin utilization deacetylase AcuC-like enzyme